MNSCERSVCRYRDFLKLLETTSFVNQKAYFLVEVSAFESYIPHHSCYD
ncbi:hypothetical protein NUACC26_084020 [Scytonema sp. NUACC26]